MMHIRLATPDDAAGILAIYKPVVEQTAISFELAPPTVEDMRGRIAKTMPQYPYLVCEADGVVAGYVYGSTFRSRPAYQWTVEVTVYVHEDYRKRGIARALYTALFALVKAQGYMTALSVIALPNDASIYLHESMGFETVGVFRNVGYKLGKWHDTGWWQLALNDALLNTYPPKPITDLSEDEVTQALNLGIIHLK